MGLREKFNRWAEYNRTVRELNALNARELNELGISRFDIPRIARGETGAL